MSSYYLTNSISLGRQVLLIQGSSGPYIRRMVNQLFPGMVSSQLLSLLSLGVVRFRCDSFLHT